MLSETEFADQIEPNAFVNSPAPLGRGIVAVISAAAAVLAAISRAARNALTRRIGRATPCGTSLLRIALLVSCAAAELVG
jgi:hypothetical protein